MSDLPAYLRDEGGPIILFDGVCNLCNASVQWVIRRDDEAVFRFATLQSEEARRRIEQADPNFPTTDSIVLLDQEGAHIRSEAAIRIARRLGLPWSLMAVFRAIPLPVRDAIYDFVARNRYRWFGRQASCMIPRPGVAQRFLDADEPRG